jgi:hypothetical protein
MAVVFWSSDGLGKGVGAVHKAFIRWVRANTTADLIVNGGDVYGDGTPEEFELVLEQMDGSVPDVCETAGNHDWNTRATAPATGEIPSGYEGFWERFPPPLSRQPIDTSKRGGARYEHIIDLAGWRLLFLDTGPCKHDAWPMGDAARLAWLRQAVTEAPGRAKIVFAHHSRLSRGKHGDINNVDALWQALFDDGDTPRVALTLAGHDHNVSIYGPRPRSKPHKSVVDFARGVYVLVNGAGGRGHDVGFRGTAPDMFFDDDNYCLTRITLRDAHSADIDILSFGPDKEPALGMTPQVVRTLQIRV